MSTNQAAAEFEGTYEMREAARYLVFDVRRFDAQRDLASRKLIRWIHAGLSHPDLVGVPGRQLLITFEDLISMRVIGFLRALGYSFPKIRKAEEGLRAATSYPRPFATDDIWADKAGAIDIFGEMASDLLAATRHGQLAFEGLFRGHLTRLHGLTFDERGVADSWTPMKGVLLNPRIQFGRPCVAGTRIPTADLVGMVEAGDAVAFLAESYGIASEQVNEAVAWERELAAT